MKKALLVAVGVLSIGAGYLVLTGFRGGGCGFHGHADPARMERMITNHLEDTLDDLAATPEQRTRILAIKDRLVARGKALHLGQPGAHQELVAQWDAESPDMAKVDALIDERAEAMKAFAHDVAGALAEVHGVLTPEQRAKLSKRIHRRAGE
jgi:Spy/CpxP family protein refolding chaperone